jgi:Zn-dependent peptidase ImmA (M78 family)
MNYDNYRKIRAASWQTLLDCHIEELPVKVSAICETYGYTLRSYSAGIEMINALGLGKQCTISDGFAVMHKGRFYIFYDDKCTLGRQRFTIAHEIGHIIVGHLHEGDHSTVNEEQHDGESETERQANQYAARLLAPACVLNAIKCITPEQIEKTCQISRASAEYRSMRMHELVKRNRFLIDPLEKMVIKQFEPYIIKLKAGSSV